MCGRFALSAKTSEIEKLLHRVKFKDELNPRYNIAPSQQIAAVINTNSKEITYLRWGLIPFWAKDKKIGFKMINARAESLLEKPSFKTSFRKKRCLILADGFFEWKKIKGSKRKAPYFFKMKNGKPFAFAGLWDEWRSPEDETIISGTIITAPPNDLVKQIHDRMPAIVPEQNFEEWLSNDSDIQALKNLLKPYPSEQMEAREVSLEVNNPVNDYPDIIAPANKKLF